MKKSTATLGAATIVALSALGLGAPAHAAEPGYPDVGGVSNEPTTPQGVGEQVGQGNGTGQDSSNGSDDTDGSGNAAGQSSSGVLPSTGGPEGALLIGGAALAVVGGVAVAATRRRKHA